MAIKKRSPKGARKSLSAMVERAKSNQSRRPSAGNAPHLIVQARAGTGKTFTLVEGLNRIMGKPTPGIIPSPQQAAVWEAMQDGPRPGSATFVAFNRSIAQELVRKVPRGCAAMTLHSMGFRAVCQAYGKVEVNNWKTQNLIEDHLGTDIRQLRREDPVLVQATEKLVNLSKLELVHNQDGEICDGLQEPEAVLDDLCNRYEVELNGQRDRVYALVPVILERAREHTAEVDFSDMIWLPVVNNLPVFRSDLLLVDEAQDLNRCQQALALRAGSRLVLCGDPCQAIYGFAGADTESIPRMKTLLETTPRGCRVLPLTVSRRCGRAIVWEAAQIVPDFEAFEGNPEGEIITVPPEQVNGNLGDGDMVLCRVNAPLISLVFRLLKEHRKANIQGRDIGQGLLNLIDRLKAQDVDGLLERLDDYHHQETQRLYRRKNPSEASLIALQDKVECIRAFCDGATDLEKVRATITAIFQDDSQGGILLSSVHRAKGLEAPRVFILEPGLMPHPMAKTHWQKEQEQNLKYVAITRAIQTLVWVRQ